MSNSVEQRILEMRFDNQQFEKGISTTLDSLKKLDDKFGNSKGQEAFAKLDQAANSVDFSSVESAVSQIESHFSVFGVVAFNVISRVTNALMDMGQSAVRAATIQPMLDGLDEYKLKMDSITTIKTNTMGKSTLEDINKSLSELNEYADKTIYNFAEMTHNIGTFTSAGVDLETSVSSIKGIANLAATSGASSAQASNAMYQLSQAIASGTVKLQDWNSVVNSNMGGKLFQEALLRTSDAIETGGRAAVENAGSFRESLKAGWLTTDVLTKTLRNFTLANDEASRTLLANEGYSAEAIEQILKEADAAEEAATKVRTIQQLVDTTKEALGSGWAQTWEYIIGDLDQASELWTRISEGINGVIDGMSDARNNILATWNAIGGRTDLIEGMFTLIGAFGDLLAPIGEAFNEVFAGFVTAEGLAGLSKQFRNFAESFRYLIKETKTGQAVLTAIKTVFTALFTIVKTVATVVGTALAIAFRVAGFAINLVVTALDGIISVASAVLDFFYSLVGARIVEGFSKLAEGVGYLIDAIKGDGGAFDKFKDWLTSINSGFAPIIDAIANAINKAGEAFSNFARSAKDTAAEKAILIFEKLQAVWTKVQPVFESIRSTLAGAWNVIVTAFQNANFSAEPFLEFLSKASETFGTFFEELLNGGLSAETFGKLFEGLKTAGQELIAEFMPSFESFTTDIGMAIYNHLEGPLKDLAGWVLGVTEPLDSLSQNFAFNIDNVKNLFSGFKLPGQDDPNSSLFGKAADDIASQGLGLVSTLTTLANKLKSPMGTLKEFWKNAGTSLSEAVHEFIAALDSEELKSIVDKILSAGTIAASMAALYGIYDVATSASKLLRSLAGFPEALTSIAKGIAGLTTQAANVMKTHVIMNIAISIGILVAALAALTFLDYNKVEQMVPVLLRIMRDFAILIAVFMAITAIPSFSVAGIAGVASAIGAMSGAMVVMVAMVAILGKLDKSQIDQGMSALLAMMVVIGLLSVMMRAIPKGAGAQAAVAFIGLGVAIALLVQIAKDLSQITPGELSQGEAIMAGILAIFLIYSLILGVYGPNMAKGSTSLLVFAGSVVLIAATLGGLAQVASPNLITAATIIGLAIIAMLGTIVALSHISDADIAKATTSLITFSVTIGILGAVIAALAAVGQIAGTGNLAVAGAVIATLVILMGVAGMLAGKGGVGLALAGKQMLIFAGAVAILSGILIAFSFVPFDQIVVGMTMLAFVVTAAIMSIAGLGMVAEKFAPGLWSLTLLLAGFGAAALAFGAAVALIALSLEPLSQHLPAAAAAFIEALNVMAVGLWNSKENIALGIAGLGSAIIAGLIMIIPLAVAGIVQLVASLITAFLSSIPSLVNAAMVGIIQFCHGMANAIRQNAREVLAAVGDLLLAIGEFLWNALLDLLGWVGDFLGDVWNQITGKTQEMHDAAKSTGESTSAGFDEGSSNFGDNLKKKQDEAVQGLYQGAGEAKNAAAAMGLGISEGTNEGIGRWHIFDMLRSQWNWDALPEWFRNSGLAQGIQYGDGANEGLAQWDPQSPLQGVMDSVTGITGDIGMQGADAFGTSFSDEMQANVDLTGLMTGEQSIDMGALNTEFSTAGSESAMAFVDSLQNGLQADVGGAVAAMASSARQPDSFTAAGLTDGLAVVTGFKGGTSSMPEAASSAAIAAVDKLSGYSGSAYDGGWDVGNNMTSGLINGLGSRSSELGSKAYSIVSDAIAEMKKAADEASPSKETTKIAEFMDQGLINGLQNLSGKVSQKAGEVVEDAIVTMSAQAEYVNALSADMSDQPVIRPVLDLTDYEAGLRRMQGLETYNQVGAAAWANGRVPAMLSDTGNMTSNQQNVTVVLDYNAGETPNDIAWKIGQALKGKAMMEG